MFFAQATGNTPKCDSPVQSQWYTPERDLDNGADIKIFLGDLPEISPQTRKKCPLGQVSTTLFLELIRIKLK